MSIMLTEENSVGIWYVTGEVDGEEQDWMGHIGYEEIEGKRKLVLTYRFRYYADKLSFESKDRKSWYKCVANEEGEPIEELLASVRHIIGLVQTRMGAKKYDEILIKDFPNFEAFFNYFSNRPWAHVKEQLVGQA